MVFQRLNVSRLIPMPFASETQACLSPNQRPDTLIRQIILLAPPGYPEQPSQALAVLAAYRTRLQCQCVLSKRGMGTRSRPPPVYVHASLPPKEASPLALRLRSRASERPDRRARPKKKIIG